MRSKKKQPVVSGFWIFICILITGYLTCEWNLDNHPISWRTLRSLTCIVSYYEQKIENLQNELDEIKYKEPEKETIIIRETEYIMENPEFEFEIGLDLKEGWDE